MQQKEEKEESPEKRFLASLGAVVVARTVLYVSA